MSRIKVKRAILSVYDKSNIVELARFLNSRDIEILSTGGTFQLLKENQIDCTSIEAFTGQPELFGGRVKTLHPKIHAGILSKRDQESDRFNIAAIDLVVVNLYPFEQVVAQGEQRLEQLIEMIDIGGPTMLRAAAKNYQFCCPVSRANDYALIMEQLKDGGISLQTSLKLANSVFRQTAYYDSLINRTLSQAIDEQNCEQGCQDEGKVHTIPLKKHFHLRYGENPQQNADYYCFPGPQQAQLAHFFSKGKLHGKELSYNNIVDSSSCIRIMADLPEQACVVIKHSNPCGCAARETVEQSFQAAYEGDQMSIYGGIVGCKGIINEPTAKSLSSIFLEIIIAESFTQEAYQILAKKKNVRLLQYREWKDLIFNYSPLEYKTVLGGILIQDTDNINPRLDENFEVVTRLKPEPTQTEDLKFAQTLVKHVKSNAIVIVKDKMLLGVGAGQMNRVTAARIALDWAAEKARGAVMGSDAYFPMDDTVKLAAARGVKAIIQPGGSIRDLDSIEACDQLKLSMVMTGKRHFYH